jgi:hypothetical protein
VILKAAKEKESYKKRPITDDEILKRSDTYVPFSFR